MKPYPLAALLTGLAAMLAFAGASFSEVAKIEDREPGLVVTEHPRHSLQQDRSQGFNLPIEDLGKPVGEPSVTESLHPWKWNGERNAMATGFLEVPEDGDYWFTTRSFYDRNYLIINDQTVCKFGDGDDHVASIALKKGPVKITVVGVVESRGTDQGIRVRWKPPGQLELSPIPTELLWHVAERPVVKKALVAPPKPDPAHLITAADDFIVDAYHNGVKIADSRRKILEERFGATVERIETKVRPGDWLVFQVANNRLRWGGVRYFAVAGMQAPNQFQFVSDPVSRQWSVCDDPAQAAAFIRNRDAGTDKRAKPIDKPWQDGDGLMRRFAGSGFDGKPLWGSAPMTWIKYIAPERDLPPGIAKPVPVVEAKPKPQPAPKPPLHPMSVKRWPVQILSATYGTGGKNADVTAKVKEHVEVKKHLFTVTPPDLGADPNPYWNKGLHIVYMKDGVRREQHRGENEWVLPESFYGPQDADELRAWLAGSRWINADGEIQFHANRILTGNAIQGAPIWEPLGPNKMRITWSSHHAVEYAFDYTWSSFSVPSDAKQVFHVVK